MVGARENAGLNTDQRTEDLEGAGRERRYVGLGAVDKGPAILPGIVHNEGALELETVIEVSEVITDNDGRTFFRSDHWCWWRRSAGEEKEGEGEGPDHAERYFDVRIRWLDR